MSGTGSVVAPAKKDKLAEIRQRLEDAIVRHAQVEDDLRHATTDAKRSAATERLTKAWAKVEELRAKLRKEEGLARYREAEARLATAREELEEAALAGFASDDLADEFEGILTERVRELINLRRTGNLIGRRAKELTDLVRAFVLRRPTGWVAGKTDPEQQYLCWLSKDGELQVVLEDNPRYELTVDQLVALIGFSAASQFLAVQYTAVHAAAKDGLLVRQDDATVTVTVDDLVALRERHERTKSVELTERGSGSTETVVDIVAPELADAFVDRLEVLGLDGNIHRALAAAGITRIGQVRCLSGDDLARIKGIGPARAGMIIAAVVRKQK